MTSSIEPPGRARALSPERRPTAGVRGAMNRLAFATAVLVVIAIFTTICFGAALAASLLSMG